MAAMASASKKPQQNTSAKPVIEFLNGYLEITSSKSKVNGITECLSYSYRTNDKILFLGTSIEDGSSKQKNHVLVRFRHPVCLQDGDRKLQAKKLADIFKLQQDTEMRIVGMNLTDSAFLGKHHFLSDQPSGAYATLGKFPHEGQGYRGDLDQQGSLNANYGSMLASDPIHRYALKDLSFLIGLESIRDQMHMGPLYEDSTQSAQEHGSEMAARAAQGISLLVGQRAKILRVCNTGSDANNQLVSIAAEMAPERRALKGMGVVAVGLGCYAAARGPMRALSSRPFVLALVRNCQEMSWRERNNRVWRLQYGHYEEGQSLDESKSDCLLSDEQASLQEIEQKIEAARAGGYPIRILLLELILSHTGQTIRRQFLTRLSAVLAREKIALAVDDIMAGIRCGQHFSIMMYGMRREEWPINSQFITFGKSYMMSGLIALSENLTVQDQEAIKRATGFVTREFSDIQLYQLLELLRVTGQHGFLNGVRQMLQKVQTNLKSFLDQNEGSFVRGRGGMIFTNIQFDLRAMGAEAVQYNRMLPPLNASEGDLQQLKPTGVYTCIAADVNQHTRELETELQRIWGKCIRKCEKSESKQKRQKMSTAQSASEQKKPMAVQGSGRLGRKGGGDLIPKP